MQKCIFEIPHIVIIIDDDKRGKRAPLIFLYLCTRFGNVMKKGFFIAFIVLCVAMMTSAQNRELVILHTNDTHSQIEPYTHKQDTNVGGFLRRDVLIQQQRAANPALLVVDAGDFSQGTPYFNFFKGYTEVYLMNKMGYDAVTCGNHEFDNGSVALARRLKKANFPMVNANYVFKNRKLAKLIKPYTIVEKGGLRIGVFGLTVNLQGLTAPENMRELTYLDPVVSARKVVAELQAQNCDLIVCLSHLGYEEGSMNDVKLATEVQGIDVIIGGHTHTALPEPRIVGNTRIYQLANRGKNVGKITLTY